MNRSKIQIAAEVNLSRFRVARLINHARSTGRVSISVADAGNVDGAPSLDRQDRIHLRNARPCSNLSAALNRRVYADLLDRD